MTKRKQLMCILFPLIIPEMFLQLHCCPPVVNSIDWTWFRKTPTCRYKVPQLTVHVRPNTKPMRSKELSVELRDRIVWRNRSGEGYQNISAALKVNKNTVAFIILKWKLFGTTKTLPRAGRPAKLSNRGRNALVREVTKNPMVTVTEL